MTRPRKITIPIQFEQSQIDNMDRIMEFYDIKAYAVLIRKVFDYYVAAEFPQLIPLNKSNLNYNDINKEIA